MAALESTLSDFSPTALQIADMDGDRGIHSTETASVVIVRDDKPPRVGKFYIAGIKQESARVGRVLRIRDDYHLLQLEIMDSEMMEPPTLDPVY